MRIISVVLFFAASLLITPFAVSAQSQDEVVEATVVKVVEQSTIIESDGSTYPYQRLSVLGTSGSIKGDTLIIENGRLNQINAQTYETGDKLMLSLTNGPGGERLITISDYVRRVPLYILTGIFIILAILIGGKRGASSIVGMGITFALLFLFVLPQLSSGENPIFITSIAIIIIVPITFLLSHGINKKTYCAIIGTFIALLLAGVLSQIAINAAHLTGFASEEAGFLDVLKQGRLDIKGLLFAGILIALLGILEDITVSQSAIVFQLKKANKSFDMIQLFKRSMDIGRDHIASMANTLILVYAGASLPLLLLFVDNPLPFSTIINNEILAEEIVRTLVASIALILAVPITTLVAAFAASHNSNKSKLH